MNKENIGIKEHIERTINPILNKFLQETPKTPIPVLIKEKPLKKFCMFNPHNYRLWFKYEKSSKRNIGGRVLFSCGVEDKTSIGNIGGRVLVSCGKINFGKELLFIFKDFDIKIKKKTIEVTYKNSSWFRVPVVVDSDKYFIDIIVKLETKMLNFLIGFVELWGGLSDFKIIKRHSENKIRDEDFINTIPLASTWNNEISKKVYTDSHDVEFKKTIFASNYITNQAIKQKDSKNLDNNKELIGILNPLNFLKFYVKCVDDVLKYGAYVKLLTDPEKSFFDDWLFQELSIHP